MSEFIYKWERANLNERAAFQTYFNDLCELVGHDTPEIADPEGKDFKYEKFVIKAAGGSGYVDVAYRGKFIWEQKSKGEDLGVAYRQALEYLQDFGNPPLIVVGDFERIIIHTNFNNTEYTTYEITLSELGEQLHLIESLFHKPEELKPNDVQSSLAHKPSLSINFEQVERVHISSGFGLVQQYGGPAPNIHGHTEYQIVLINSSYRTAKLITVDLRINLTPLHRPELERSYESDYRFESSSDIYCLPRDKVVLDTLEFSIQTIDKSLELENLIQQTKKEIDKYDWQTERDQASVHVMKLAELEHPSGVNTFLNDEIQSELLSVYHQNPARDIYTLEYDVRAEGFAAFRETTRIEIHWSKYK